MLFIDNEEGIFYPHIGYDPQCTSRGWYIVLYPAGEKFGWDSYLYTDGVARAGANARNTNDAIAFWNNARQARESLYQYMLEKESEIEVTSSPELLKENCLGGNIQLEGEVVVKHESDEFTILNSLFMSGESPIGLLSDFGFGGKVMVVEQEVMYRVDDTTTVTFTLKGLL